MNLKMQENLKKAKQNDDELVRKLEEKRLEIAYLKGTIQELEKKCGQWKSKHGLEISHV